MPLDKAALVHHLHRRRKREETATVQALVGLHVQFISLVPNPANKRPFIVKALRGWGGMVAVQKSVRVVKANKKRQMLYGIVLAPDELDDEQDTISKEEIEKAAYLFMQKGRLHQIDADHDGEAQKGYVAESWLVRKGDALFPKEAVGSWAVGIKVTDKAVWKRVDAGKLLGFSVAGVAKRQPVKVTLIKKKHEARPMRKDRHVKKGTTGLAGALVAAVLEQEGYLADGVGEEVLKDAVLPAESEDLHEDTQAMLDLLASPDGFVEGVVKALREHAQDNDELLDLLDEAGITGLFDEDPGVEKALPSRATRRLKDVPGRSRRRRDRAPVEAGEPIEKQTPLGARLSKARDAQDLTIAEMAAWADRSPSTMSAILKGDIEDPPDEVLKALAPHLTGVSAKTLIKLRDDHVEAGVKKAEPDDDGDLEEVTLEIPARQEATVEKTQAGEVADGAGAVSVEKFYATLDAVEVETAAAVGKGASFKERMLKNQLWTITSALSDALRDVLGDKLVKNKVKAVRMVVDEFVDWLEEQVGDAVKKDDALAAAGDEELGDEMADQKEIVEAVQKQTDVLEKIIQRLHHLEKQHPGRQSLMGGEDIDVVKGNQNGQTGKGFRGLKIDLS